MTKSKKILSLFLSLVMLLSLVQGVSLSAFADESNPFWVKVGSDISQSSLTKSNAKTLVQNNSSSTTEQLTLTASGSTLKISGKTSLAPLPAKSGYTPIYVTTFKNCSSGSFGSPYIYMLPVKCKDAKGNVYYSFSGEYNFSSVPNGTYKMYLWRGYKDAKLNYFYMSSSLSKVDSSLSPGILHYADVLKVTSGKVEVVKYDQVASANAAAYKKINAISSKEFLDTSLKDIVFANRDPKNTSDKGAALTSAQRTYIANVAKEITKNASTTYDKVKCIYEYVASNIYYDDKRPGNVGTKSANSNPYVNLKGLRDKSMNNYNIYNGKVATNCVGYAAMVAAMARSLGIPTRIVNGVHITDATWETTKNSLNVADHHWAECYVNGKWIMVDANMGSQNHYNGSSWTYTGLSNYAFFDATDDEIATNYIVKAVYRYNDDLVINWPVTLTLGTSAYTYDGKAKKPSVVVKDSAGKTVAASNYTVSYSNNVNVGTATAKVTFKAPFSGTASKSFKINPKGTSLSSLTAQYKGFTVKLAKQATQTTGYQIQYSTASNFSNAKVSMITSNKTLSKTLTGLSAKKKYYVRVRTYKTVNGVNYYSGFSSAKTVTSLSYPSSISLSATSYTYDGKVKKPTVTVKNNGTKVASKYYTVSYSSGRKNVGTYTVTIKFKAPYSGTVKKTFKIVPKNTSISGLTAASKAFTVKIKKYTTQTTGYQIQYSTSSKFTNAKTVTVKNTATSKKITGLTGKKKYYVRIRTYKTVGSTKYYSSWSGAKTVTTKK